MTDKQRNVPYRRFKEFENADAWEQRKLENVVDVNSGKDYKHLKKGHISVYGTGGYMLSVNEALSYNQDAIGIGRKGTIDKPYVLQAPFWTVDTLFYSIPKDEQDLNFLFAIFQSIQWKKYDESTGVPSLSKSTINNVNVMIPKIEEQKKIGSLLKRLDNLITLHQRKYDKLKSLKSACLTEMFPAEGERKPKRRFSGFTDDWEQRKLSEIAIYRNGKAHEKKIVEKGNYIVVNSKFISTNGQTKKHSATMIEPLKKGEIAFVLSDVPNGKAIARTFLVDKNDKYSLNQRIAGLTPFNCMDSYFLSNLMNRNSYFLKFDDGVGQTNLSKSDVINFSAYYPTQGEQEKIGKFLQKLDHLITLHQQQLEKLKNLKQAYLNEMFV